MGILRRRGRGVPHGAVDGAGRRESQPRILRLAVLPQYDTALDDSESLGAGGRAEFIESGGEVGGKCVLGVGGEFVAMAGEIENVDGGLAFGVDESDLDIALVD